MKSAEILGAVMIIIAVAYVAELVWDAVKARLSIFKIIDRKGS